MYEDEGEVKKKERIRISSLGGDNISLARLTKEEVESIEGMVYNHFWVTVTDGRLEVVRRKEELPAPIQDEEMLPFWRRATPGNKQLQLFDVMAGAHSMSSIIIQHLCGYNYTPESYVRQAQKLESYGFVCMRSRRGNDSRFWELWFLPSLWSARGDLKDALNLKAKYKKNVEKAVNFLCYNVQFGTLDIALQKAAMSMDEW